ncbi:protein phosphatase 1D [Rhipicephalus sanguineus]|uniref:protein phosphatase 1D n=1 Tax=Rhipicephalus sanguineus TaxID=34632 RepID=UPI001894E74A|nr:protein phosphatase 1D [Rhipicephalus sanguineus]
MIGLNLRVTGHCNQGGRKYMEDAFVVAYQQTKDKADLEYAYFGIFDGHGGREAALYAKEHLLDAIVKQSDFWSNNDEHVLRAIKHGFLTTHLGMWKEVGKWPKTMSGLPSTSGTTASIGFIRRGKLFIGHVGDSRIVLGSQSMDGENWYGQPLTHDHKPENPREKERIHSVGGLVMNKSGVDRVVWNRPCVGHRGPVRRSTHFDKIPFLAVARSLGDLWSYNYTAGKFVVSPEPDVSVVKLDTRRDRCIVMASDGLWNMVDITEAVRYVQQAERDNEHAFLEAAQAGSQDYQVYNPSKMLVDEALYRWGRVKTRADNTSVVTVMLDPAGPSRNEVLLRQRFLHRLRPREEVRAPEPQAPPSPKPGSLAPDERELSPPRSPSSDPESDEPEGMRGLPRVVILTPKRVYPSISPPSLRAEAMQAESQESRPESMPEPSSESMPEPSVESRPEPSSESRPEPSSESRPEPSSESRPEPSSESRPEPSSESRPEPGSESRPEPSSESRPEPSSESVPEPSSESMPEPRSESMPEPSSESMPEPSWEPNSEPSQEPSSQPECKPPEQEKEASDSREGKNGTAGSHKRRLSFDAETEEVAQKRPHDDSEDEATDAAADNPKGRTRKTRL